jgi:Flp pilus assembly protein TadG|tara:strand:- start:194 stop:607 length:414 start_codon:yes stop_codon:yes gene_type:complete
MSLTNNRFTLHIKKFGKSESGSSTLEALIWVPIIVYLLTIIADFSFVFYGKAQALRLLQDSNRALSVGHVTTTNEVEDLVRIGMSHVSEQFSVTTTVISGIIKTSLTLPATSFTSVGAVPGLSNVNVTIASQHFLEQ